MSKPKVFIARGSDAFLPREWRVALDMPTHNIQGTYVIVAMSKAEAVALLTDRGIGQAHAEDMVKTTRLARGSYGDHTQAVIDAGLLDPTRGGQVLAWHNGVNADKVVSVDVLPTVGPRVVGAFRYDRATHRVVVDPTET